MAGGATGPGGRRTVGAGAFVATGSHVATAVAGGLMGIVVARLLGPADTGSFNVVLSALLLLTLLSTFGIHVGTTFYVNHEGWAPGEAFRQTQLGAFLLGGLGGALGLGISLSFGTEAVDRLSVPVLIVLAAAVPFAVAWTCSSFVALALDRYEAFALASVTANALALCLVAVLAPPFDLTGAVIGLAAAQVLTAIGYVVWGWVRLPHPEPGWLGRTPARLRRAAAFGLKGYLTPLLALINYRADLFVLSAVVGGSTVGEYAVALAVAELGLLMPRALNAVVFPRVAALEHAAGEEAQQEMVIDKAGRHVLLQAPAIAALLVIGLLLVPFVYGEGFRGALVPGLILIPGILGLGLTNVLGAAVTGKGKPEYLVYAWLLVTPVSLLLYVLLIPALGAEGAALASSAAYLLNALATLWFFVRTTGDASLRRLLPGREELADYRLLARRARSAAAARRAS